MDSSATTTGIKTEVDPEIQRQFQDLLLLLKDKANPESIAQIENAFLLACKAHKGVKRKSGEPFVIHPLAVARITVEEMGMGSKSVIAALLHDVVEDSRYTLDDIRSMFGDKIAALVDGLTKITGAIDENVSVQAVNFRKMLVTLVDDVRVIMIKLADRLHNMRTLDSMPRNKQIKFSGETIYLYAPLAHRLGFYTIKTELENLSLKYRYPEVFEELQNKITATEKTREYYIENFSSRLREKFIEHNIHAIIQRAPISIYNIWYLMQFENMPFEQAYDLLRVNIIFKPTPDVPEKFQCWSIYSLITDLYMPKPEMIHDFLTKPKANGYEALHATFMGPNGKWVEVHIRSERMQKLAERGLSAYLDYRREHPSEEGEIDKWLNRVRELIETPDVDALEFLDEFKLNLYSSEIMVFTPKGHIKTLPTDATALDLAFEIHSEIGNKALAAKVNHKLVPLSHKLNSGDQVEILTAEKNKTSYEWLDFVITAKARTSIKKALKAELKHKIKKGKEIFNNAILSLNIEVDQHLYKRLYAAFVVHSRDELYTKIASGHISASSLQKELTRKQTNRFIRYWQLQIAKTLTWNKKNTPAQNDDGTILINPDDRLITHDQTTQQQSVYKIASCCKPIPGEEVIGHSAPRGKVIIHKANCPNAIKIMSRHANLIIPVKWTSYRILSFPIRLTIEGIDNHNIYKDITTQLADKLDVRIRSFSFNSQNGLFTGQIDLYVHDTKDLNNLILDIGKINGIEHVRRIEIKEDETH